MMRPAVLFACIGFACGNLPSKAAESDGIAPSPSERAWIANCLAKTPDEKAANKACVSVVLSSCLGLKGAPKSIKSSDQFAHPRSCAPVEEKIWDEYLNRWYADAMKSASADMKELLRTAQRSWITYRDAKCNVESALNQFPLGEDNRATCRLEQTAMRALEMRRIVQEQD